MLVDDGKVGVDRQRPRGRGIEAEETGASLPRGEHRFVGHLELAEHGVVRWQLDSAELPVRPGRHRDRRLPGPVDLDQRHARLRVELVELERDARLAEPRERLVGEHVPPDGRDHRHVRAEARAGDCLVRALSPGNAGERRAADGLARVGEVVDLRDEIEVDGADDDDPWSHAAIVRRSA